jgi:uncharacterized protein YbjT (DUF2867 family)
MSKPVVFVIGATGNVGSATVQSLSTRFSDKLEIRAGVRNPDKADKLKDLKGVSVVQAEMGVKDKLIETFKGVDALYIVTPGTENRAQLTIVTAEAAKMAGVKHILVVSVPTASLTDTVFGKQLYEVESAVSKMGVPYTFLRLPLFIDNYWGFKGTIQEQSQFYSPVDPTKPYTPVVVSDAGVAAAIILSDPARHTNKTYTLVSDRHTFGDVAAAFSDVLGKEVKYIRVPYDDLKKSILGLGSPEWRVNGLLDFYISVDSGAANQEHIANGDFERITGEKPTSLKTWLPTVGDVFQEQQ